MRQKSADLRRSHPQAYSEPDMVKPYKELKHYQKVTKLHSDTITSV